MRIAVVLQLLVLTAVSRSARLAGGVQIRRLTSGDPSDEQLAESVRRLLSAEVDLQPSDDWWERHCMFVLLDGGGELNAVCAVRTEAGPLPVHVEGLPLGASRAHIAAIVVRERVRRQGFGTRLLGAVLDELDPELTTLYARPSNVAGRALYAKAGFTEHAEEVRGYYRGSTPENGLLLLRWGPARPD